MEQPLFVWVQYQTVPGKREEFLRRMLAAGIPAASRNEPGNLRYECLIPAEQEDQLCLLEIWQDEAAQQAHRLTPHYQALTALKQEYVTEVQIETHRVTA